ncbi:hypothetical protein MMC09_002179 [Bachmanniomyces sp. S44760]|nr:hypothetical protein [Bachmanniomyces sp. S44760]
MKLHVGLAAGVFFLLTTSNAHPTADSDTSHTQDTSVITLNELQSTQKAISGNLKKILEAFQDVEKQSHGKDGLPEKGSALYRVLQVIETSIYTQMSEISSVSDDIMELVKKQKASATPPTAEDKKAIDKCKGFTTKFEDITKSLKEKPKSADTLYLNLENEGHEFNQYVLPDPEPPAVQEVCDKTYEAYKEALTAELTSRWDS